jgi:hypothetical protein
MTQNDRELESKKSFSELLRNQSASTRGRA